MKINSRFYLPVCLCLLLAGACSDNKPGDPQVSNDTYDSLGTTDTMSADRTGTAINEEMEQYRTRINTRISELDADIDREKREREAEKDRKKWKSYDERISDRETRRNNFRAKLDQFGNQTKEGWQDFKREVDEMFDRDKDTTSNNNH